MSQFVINKSGTDQVTLEMMAHGSSESSANLKHEILDPRLKYVFCVDSLNVPLNACPINPITNQELFRVLRRNVGTSIDGNADVAIPILLVAAELQAYVLAGRKFFDVTTFVQALNTWAKQFEHDFTLTGIEDFEPYGGVHGVVGDASIVAPLQRMPAKLPALIQAEDVYDLIRFKMSVDGALSVQMHSNFTNNFVLKFTRIGAELLGFSNQIHSVVVNLPGLPARTETQHYMAVTTTVLGVKTGLEWLAAGNIMVLGGNVRDVQLFGEHSLYQVCDQRVMISVESHLPMLGNVLVREGKETVDRNIVESFFDQRIKSTMKFDEEGAFIEQYLTNTVYSGQFPFVRKDQRNKQWHRLLTSFDQRFFRFYLFITYRNYDSATDKWIIKPQRLEVPENCYWDFTLRFLSEV